MGMYRDKVLPRIADKVCGMKSADSAARPGLRRPPWPSARDRLRLWTQHAALPGRRHRRDRDRAVRPGLEFGRRTPGGDDRPRHALGARRPEAAAARRQLRHRGLHVDALHDPRRQRRPRRGPPGPDARRHLPFRRARPGTRRRRAAMAAPFRADPEAPVRRLPPHPTDRRPPHRCRVHHQRARRVLRGVSPRPWPPTRSASPHPHPRAERWRPPRAWPTSTSPTSTTSPTASPTTSSRSTAAKRPCGGTSRPRTRPTARGSGRSPPTPRRSQVLRDPATYSSERGGDRRHGGTLLQDLHVAGVVLNMMDDPRHARIRRLVSAGLTPGSVARLEDDLRRRARALVATVERRRAGRLRRRVAAELPMQAICILLGVPEEDRHELSRRSSPPSTSARRRREHGRRGRGHARPDARLRRGADRREAGRPGRRHALGRRPRHAGRRRAAAADRRRALLASSPCSSPPAPTPPATPSPAGCSPSSSVPTSSRRSGPTRRCSRRHRGDAAVDHAVAVEAAHGHAAPPSWRATTIEPGDKVLFWEASANRDEAVFDRPDGVRHPPRPEPAPRVRPRHALLPRRQPGPAGDAGPLRGAAAPFGTYELASRPSGRAATATPASGTCTSRFTST